MKPLNGNGMCVQRTRVLCKREGGGAATLPPSLFSSVAMRGCRPAWQ